MNKEDLAKLYEKANGWSPAPFQITMDELERFATLVEAHVNAKEKERQRYDIHSCGPDCDRYICVAVRKARQEERNKLAAWMIERSYATGHGDTMEDLLKELAWQIEERNNT